MKQISDNKPPSLPLLLAAVGCFVILTLVAGGLSLFIAGQWEIPITQAILPPLDLPRRNALRLLLLVSNLLPFAGAAVASLLIVYRGRWRDAAGLNRPVSPTMTAMAAGLFVLSLPVVAYAAWANLQFPLPDWAVADEARTNSLLEQILRMESPAEFFLAFITVAVVPALGEELLLRGVLQRRIFQPLFGNHHLAIWLAAAVFSAGHMEFAGFLPRLLLGAALGYAYFWSGSLWVPVLLHLLFNGLQVIQAYVTGEFRPDTQVDVIPPWWVGLGGLILAALMLRWGEKEKEKHNKNIPLKTVK